MVYFYLIVSKIYINDLFIKKVHLVSFNRLHDYFDFYKKNSTHEIELIKPLYNGISNLTFYQNIFIDRRFF